jgi:hypothetical protein
MEDRYEDQPLNKERTAYLEDCVGKEETDPLRLEIARSKLCVKLEKVALISKARLAELSSPAHQRNEALGTIRVLLVKS